MKTSLLDSVLIDNPQWDLDGQKRLQLVFDNALDAILLADGQMLTPLRMEAVSIRLFH